MCVGKETEGSITIHLSYMVETLDRLDKDREGK